WAVFDNGVQTAQSWQQRTTNPNMGSAYAFIQFSSSTTELAEDWLVTPKLLPDMSNNTLTFFATDDFAGNFGSIYTVRISTTSQTDRSSFTELEFYTEANFTADIYQQFSVDLSAYEGQEIYIAFVLENSKGDSWLLDDVAGPPVVAVATAPNCDSDLTNPPANDLDDVDVDVTLSWSPATGDPTGYKIQIGTTQGGSEFLALTDIGNTTSYQPLTDLAFDTRYYVTIIPFNTQGDAADCQEFEFATEIDPDITLDCGGANTSETRTLCYENETTEEFVITANMGNQAKITFNSGTVENNQDELSIYDGVDDTGTLLNADKLYGNAGDFAGISYVSTTGSLFVRLTPDGSNSCADGEQTELNFTASCESCTPPTIVSVSDDCDAMNDQFFIEVDISDLGNGTITATNDQNAATQSITATGVATIGPFTFGIVIVTLENSDSDCNIELPAVTVTGCPPANDECDDAITLMASTDQNCNNSVSGSLVNATVSLEEGICSFEALDVWYSFTPSNTDSYIFELTNTLLSVAIYSGDCMTELTLINEECNNEGRTVVDLTASTTYLVQVFADSGFESDFDLCAFPAPPAPSNDLCSGATVISCPAGEIENGVDITFATADDAQTCNNAPIGAGVWYTIAGDGSFLDITVVPQEWDAAIQIFTGADCNSLTCETQIDEGVTGETESILDFETVNGTTYYIYVGAATDFDVPGVFDLTVICSAFPAANIICLDDPVQEPCDSISIDNGSITGLIEACEDITTTESAVVVESGAMATLTAGVSITLQAGFHAKAGSDFHAFIAACAPAAQEEEIENRTANVQEKMQLQISPNPAKESVHAEYYTPNSEAIEITIMDMNGKIIKQIRHLNSVAGWNYLNINRGNWADGIYILNIQTTEKTLTERFVLSQ
ncbi:MAG: choice-of-anchor J domain-containing protein, partial [Bacteroidota bacterium]